MAWGRACAPEQGSRGQEGTVLPPLAARRRRGCGRHIGHTAVFSCPLSRMQALLSILYFKCGLCVTSCVCLEPSF